MGVAEVLLFAAGLVAGTVIVWLFLRERAASSETALRRESEIAFEEFRARAAEAQAEIAQLRERTVHLETADSEKRELNGQIADLRQKLGSAESSLESERKQNGEKIKLIGEAKEILSNQFKTLANEILEEKSKKFTDQNQANLTQLLDPLKTKLGEFQKKVEEVYVDEAKGRSSLGEQLRQLRELNQKLSEDANNLTRALKGDSKAQGNWGEIILERLLEESGLSRDIFYSAQESYDREDGTRAQPDVIIRLPEERHLVVDAKVSLKAYEEYVKAESDPIREEALKRHVDSIRAHIKGLSAKNYQDIHQLKSMDSVMMFVPIEPAFMLAIARDSALWSDAYKQNVLLVSPSTLLYVVRIVAQLWRQESLSKNVEDMAKCGAEVYDKVVNFVEELDKVGAGLDKAQGAFKLAYSRLKDGRGNLIGHTQKLVALGVNPKKALKPELVRAALGEPLLLPGAEMVETEQQTPELLAESDIGGAD